MLIQLFIALKLMFKANYKIVVLQVKVKIYIPTRPIKVTSMVKRNRTTMKHVIYIN